MVLDRLPRLTQDGPAYAYTVDGHVYPQIAPTVVAEGGTVEVTIVNRGFEVHPMHPHGHRVLVLEVDGRAPASRCGSTGSMSRQGRCGGSPSWPTTPVSGWTTATTSSTPHWGW